MTPPAFPESPRGGGSDRPDRSRRLYRWLLGLYPDAFLERYEDELLQLFDDRRHEARFQGTLGGLRLVTFLMLDFLKSLPLAREPRTGDRVGTMMNDLRNDLRYAFRMLIKNPVFTLAAVLTLALGIGLNAATFSAVNGLLLRPLPGTRDPQHLVQLYRKWPGEDFGSNSIPHYQDLRDRTGDIVSDVAAWALTDIAVTGEGRNERTMGMLVSANFFQTYGVTPVLGRPFLPDAESTGPGAHPVTVLGYGYWQDRFGGDPGVIGRTLVINGHPFEVVGVAPSDFKGPANFVDVPLYVPLMMQPEIEGGRDRLQARGSNSYTVVGRLKDGVTLNRVGQEMDALLVQLREEYPDSYDDQVGTTIVPQMEAGIHPSFHSSQVGMSAAMMAVVGLLLLIACVNVANLFLARARERRREIGIRLSLGAGRLRVARQLLTESLVFSTLAGLAGLGLAQLAVRVLANIRPPMDGPWHFNVEMDDRVLLFTLGISMVAGILFGLAPALQAARRDVASSVNADSARSGSRSRASRGLVVAQVALSLVLLISSGLFLRSLQGATRIDPGFRDPSSLVTVGADPGLQGYDDGRARVFWGDVIQQVRALPDVRAAALTNTLPLGLRTSDQSVSVPGYEFAKGEPQSFLYARVSEDFFSTLGIDLLEGRTFTRQDDADGAPVIVINKRMANRFWPGESAIGKTLHTAGKDRQVVGVVATGKYRSLGEAPTDMMYLPLWETFRPGLEVVARTSGDPGTALRHIQEVVRAADPDLPLTDVRTMEQHMGMALLPARLGGVVLGLFGLLGLILAAVGIYGVMAYSVAQRRREVGIRMALGADQGRVLGLVLREGLALALIGTALGLVAAGFAAHLLQGLLYNVSALDPVAFVGVPLILVGVAALAVYIPARRAAGLEPMRVLRLE